MSFLDFPIPQWLVVSRETEARLRLYLELVAKWNPAINLVSANSLSDGWNRHILDSAQLWPMVGRSGGLWLDLGSGAGFPGLVMAILAQNEGSEMRIALVESDKRKSAFLRDASSRLHLKVDVICDRIERLAPMGADVVSARAFAPLAKLLPAARVHMANGGVGIFLKGKSYLEEIEEARALLNSGFEVIPSKTDVGSIVLKVEGAVLDQP